MEKVLQLNLSTTATAGTEESGHYKEVTIVESMYVWTVHRDKN